MQEGQVPAAEACLARALQLCDELGVERQGDSRWHVLANLAELHIATGALDRAEVELGQAMELAERHGRRSELATGHRLLGRLHVRRDHGDLATAAFHRAAELFEDLRRPAELAEVLDEDAAALEARGLIADAAQRWRRAAAAALEAMRLAQSGGAADLTWERQPASDQARRAEPERAESG
jgi:tetratricopeptide (TPR) repeat protein